MSRLPAFSKGAQNLLLELIHADLYVILSLKLIRSTDEEFVLTNQKLVVIEGDRATISDKLLRVETNNRIGSLYYNITNKPKFGTIKLMNAQINDVIQVSPNIITEEQISQNR